MLLHWCEQPHEGTRLWAPFWWMEVINRLQQAQPESGASPQWQQKASCARGTCCQHERDVWVHGSSTEATKICIPQLEHMRSHLKGIGRSIYCLVCNLGIPDTCASYACGTAETIQINTGSKNGRQERTILQENSMCNMCHREIHIECFFWRLEYLLDHKIGIYCLIQSSIQSWTHWSWLHGKLSNW